MRARVGGIVLKRRFQEGSRVVQGQPMFLIDPEPVRARVGSARAEVAVAKARADEARRQRDRVLPLFEKNAVSQSRRDEAVSGFEVAQANLQAAESQLRMAQLDLEYTDVRAPITGLTSRETLSEGSLISTDQASSLLTKIVQVDPLYVEFAVPEAEAAMIRGGLAPANKSAPPPGVKLILEDGSEYPQAGAGHLRRQLRGPQLGHRASARRAAEQGRAAPSRPVHPREGRRHPAVERRVRAAQGRGVRAAGPVRLGRRCRQEGADAPGADRPRPGQQRDRDRRPAGRRSLHRRRRAEGVPARHPGERRDSRGGGPQAAARAASARRLHDLDASSSRGRSSPASSRRSS